MALGVVQLEWRDGKLTFVDPADPTWTPTLAPTDELVRFERAADGRVGSVFLAVASMQRLEPVSGE